MPPPIFPATHFTSLTEAKVMAALDDPDPGNPIAVEVARLIEGYTENFRAHVERLGYIPDSFLRVKPQAPLKPLRCGSPPKPFKKPSPAAIIEVVVTPLMRLLTLPPGQSRQIKR